MSEPLFKQRLREELQGIYIKQEKLNNFLHSNSIRTVDKNQILLMQVQYAAMSTYGETLRSRMELMGMFNAKGEDYDERDANDL